MELIYKLSLLAFFAAFFMMGKLFASLYDRRRLGKIKDAAGKIPDGLHAFSEKYVTPAVAGKYRRKLMEAGQPRGLDVDGFVALKVTGAFGGSAAALIIGMAATLAFSQVILLTGLFIVIGFFAPDVWLARLTAGRKKEMMLTLPDILDMLTISVEAGLGFDAALGRVVKNVRGALSQEFFRFLQETQLGRARREAWRNLADRTNIPDVNSFVLAVQQADVFGISIGKVLRVQAEEMRTKRRQKAEEIAMKAPVKVVFPLVLCIFPALMIVILGPAGIRISQTLTF